MCGFKLLARKGLLFLITSPLPQTIMWLFPCYLADTNKTCLSFAKVCGVRDAMSTAFANLVGDGSLRSRAEVERVGVVVARAYCVAQAGINKRHVLPLMASILLSSPAIHFSAQISVSVLQLPAALLTRASITIQQQ